MKAFTLTGIPARARRFLAAVRDSRPYVLPRGVVAGTQQAEDHVCALVRMLGSAGMLEVASQDAEGRVTGVKLSEKGRKAAEHL